MIPSALPRDLDFQAAFASTTRSPLAATSLIEPIPGHPSGDVTDMLRQFAQIPGMQDAVTAIFNLVDRESIPSTIDSDSCQKAAGLLLELGQGRLLYELALERPQTYELDIGSRLSDTFLLSDEQRAQVLGGVHASWPSDAPVSLKLSTSHSSETLLALKPFLQRPVTFSVRLVIEDGAQAAPATEFAEALRGCSIAALRINCGVPTAQAMEALSGFRRTPSR